jgi:ANTAR domain-containing protein
MSPEGAQRIHGQVSLPTGAYRYDACDDRWTLADTTRDILGLGQDATVDVSTLLGLLVHDEREQASRCVFDAIERRVPFSSLHHVARPDGPREVLVVGETTYDADRLAAVHGHVVDIGALGSDVANDRIDRAVAEVVANRATIEQAKGVLSLTYGIDGDGAIALLRWWSNHRNVKVTVLADRLVSAVRTGALSRPQLRAAVDALLASVSVLDAESDGVVD